MGNVRFDAERTGRSHADRFWAIVLACQKGREPGRRTEAEARANSQFLVAENNVYRYLLRVSTWVAP
ncbi:MAG: hypothetical protein Tsb0020_16910 [Haliangiales bacterium]